MTFWYRRCTEHSRSPRWITLPCASERFSERTPRVRASGRRAPHRIVAKDLHFNVADLAEVALQKQLVVTERVLRLRASTRLGRRARQKSSSAARTSVFTPDSASAISLGLWTMRMPLPPPPAAALMSSG
jgi:hypothetical protein